MRLETLAVAALVVSALSPLAAQDAPMFRGNLARTGVYASAGPARFSTVKWRFQTGGMVLGSPAMVNGVAYVGSTDGFVYAVDAESGALRWKFKTGARVVSSPAVDSGHVYVSSYDSFVYALDAASGALDRPAPPFDRGTEPTRAIATVSPASGDVRR